MAAKTLEDRIREAAEAGELTHLSVIPNAAGWCATYAGSTGLSRTHCTKADPVEALEGALAAMTKSERKARKKPQAEPAAEVNPWD